MIHNKYQCVLASCSWEDDLSKVSLLCPLLGSKRGQPLYLNKSESSSPNHVSSLVEIGPVVLEKSIEEKLTDDETTNGWIVMTLHVAHTSLWLRWVKKPR